MIAYTAATDRGCALAQRSSAFSLLYTLIINDLQYLLGGARVWRDETLVEPRPAGPRPRARAREIESIFIYYLPQIGGKPA